MLFEIIIFCSFHVFNGFHTYLKKHHEKAPNWTWWYCSWYYLFCNSELELGGKEHRSLRVGKYHKGGFSEYVSTLLFVWEFYLTAHIVRTNVNGFISTRILIFYLCLKYHFFVTVNSLFSYNYVRRWNAILITRNFNKWPTWCKIPFFYNTFYYCPLHVSGNVVLIIRRSECINIASGMATLCKWPFGAPDGHLQRVTIPDAILTFRHRASCILGQNWTELRGLSPRANYTDRAAAAGRRS